MVSATVDVARKSVFSATVCQTSGTSSAVAGQGRSKTRPAKRESRFMAATLAHRILTAKTAKNAKDVAKDIAILTRRGIAQWRARHPEGRFFPSDPGRHLPLSARPLPLPPTGWKPVATQGPFLIV